jgi:hypothetical protein
MGITRRSSIIDSDILCIDMVDITYTDVRQSMWSYGYDDSNTSCLATFTIWISFYRMSYGWMKMSTFRNATIHAMWMVPSGR